MWSAKEGSRDVAAVVGSMGVVAMVVSPGSGCTKGTEWFRTVMFTLLKKGTMASSDLGVNVNSKLKYSAEGVTTGHYHVKHTSGAEKLMAGSSNTGEEVLKGNESR